MLRVFGVSDVGDQIYRLLVGLPSATVAELAALVPARFDVVEREVDVLLSLGLISDSGGKPRRFTAGPPDVTIETLLLRRQTELATARGELEALVRTYRDARRVRSTDEVIEIVTGVEALTQRLLQLQHSARQSFEGFVKPPYEAMGLADAEPLVDPNVHYRVIYDRQVLEQPGLISILKSAEAARADYRLHPDLPMKLMIIDRSAALLPLVSDSAVEPSAVIVHASGLLKPLVALFEHCWSASVPLPLDDAPAEDGLDNDNRRILSMLLAGATDAAAARQLDVSVRTVQRRVTEMMAWAGVGTRIQLGWYAARNGWL